MGEEKRREAYMNLIRPNRCGTCGHRYRETDHNGNSILQCRLNPPTVSPIIAMTPKGPMMAGQVNIFPTVMADWWCAKFSAIAMADASEIVIEGEKVAS